MGALKKAGGVASGGHGNMRHLLHEDYQGLAGSPPQHQKTESLNH